VSALWFPDNTVLCNFGAVQGLELVKHDLTERGRWTAAVEFEVSRSAKVVPALATLIDEGWLGEVIETTEDEADAIERIRVAEFGGTTTQPLKHLGEAETCHVIRARAEFQDSVWITDDVAAFAHGRRLGITTWCTRTIMEHLIANGDLDEQGAFELLVTMEAAGRFIYNMPSRPAELR
jgi:hypothetical protein